MDSPMSLFQKTKINLKIPTSKRGLYSVLNANRDESGTTLFAVDPESIILLKGCTVDFEDTMARQGFVVADNPNADHSCSCKRSFSPNADLFK